MLKPLLNWQCHRTTITHILFHAVVALIPLSAGIVLLLYGKWQGWSFFWENGEFYIYSVVFLTSAIYILVNLGVKRSNFATIMMLLIIIALFASLLAYGSLVYNHVSDSAILPVDNVLRFTSLVLLCASLVFLYVMLYWEEYRDFVIEGTDDRVEIRGIIGDLL